MVVISGFIKGDETCLKRKNSKWYCNICNPKGKGRKKTVLINNMK
jgi:hypothetical protein